MHKEKVLVITARLRFRAKIHFVLGTIDRFLTNLSTSRRVFHCRTGEHNHIAGEWCLVAPMTIGRIFWSLFPFLDHLDLCESSREDL